MSTIIRNDNDVFVTLGSDHFYVAAPRGGAGRMAWWGFFHWLFSLADPPFHRSFLTFEAAKRHALDLAKSPRRAGPVTEVVDPMVEQLRKEFAP
jgi:hypothetical protein